MIVTRHDLKRLDTLSMSPEIRSLYKQTVNYIEKKGGKTFVNPNILRDLGVPMKGMVNKVCAKN